MRRRIRLTESDIRKIVKQSVKRVLNESSQDAWAALEAAKETEDPRQILAALKNLESELKAEGALEGGYIKGQKDSSEWAATPGSDFTSRFNKEGNKMGRSSRYVKTW